ncbi:MAG TPA: MFS transporter [Candidatus Hydrogenedentes bacterium]|nr:MFS transporter [Candidatus Hydrogenedentota bacterium]HPG66333.1 MFS transporter [Candidatus Hydrogenedentota bacterium]
MTRLKPHHRLYATAFLLDCALIAGFSVVPFFVMRQLGGGARMVGVVTAMQSVCYAIISLASSSFVARAKNGLTWARMGIMGYAIMFCLAPLSRNAYVYGAVSTFGSGCMGFVWPALWSWIGGERDPLVRAKRIAHYNIAWSLGLSLGPLISGPLYSIDYHLPFAFMFALAFLAWILVMTLPHETAHYGLPDVAGGRADPVDARGEAHLYYAWFANMIGWILVAACRSVFAKRVDQLFEAGRLVTFSERFLTDWSFPHAAVAFAWLVFMTNFSRMILFFLLGQTHRWQYRFSLVILFQAIAACAMFALGYTESLALMMACCFLIGLNNGMGFSAAVCYSLSNAQRKHQRSAINESMVGAGGFAGSMGFGVLAGWFGVAMPFRWSFVLVVVAMAAEIALFRYGRRRTAASGV